MGEGLGVKELGLELVRVREAVSVCEGRQKRPGDGMDRGGQVKRMGFVQGPSDKGGRSREREAVAETGKSWVKGRTSIRGVGAGSRRNEEGIAVPREGKARHLSKRHF